MDLGVTLVPIFLLTQDISFQTITLELRDHRLVLVFELGEVLWLLLFFCQVGTEVCNPLLHQFPLLQNTKQVSCLIKCGLLLKRCDQFKNLSNKWIPSGAYYSGPPSPGCRPQAFWSSPHRLPSPAAAFGEHLPPPPNVLPVPTWKLP